MTTDSQPMKWLRMEQRIRGKITRVKFKGGLIDGLKKDDPDPVNKSVQGHLGVYITHLWDEDDECWLKVAKSRLQTEIKLILQSCAGEPCQGWVDLLLRLNWDPCNGGKDEDLIGRRVECQIKMDKEAYNGKHYYYATLMAEIKADKDRSSL